jgi:antitoxin ParD1/3/4
MMPNQNTSVSLSEHFVEFTTRQVESGRFGSTSEVIRAGLRLLETEEQKMEALRLAIQEGLDSGIAIDFDVDKWLDTEFPEE